MLEFDGGRQVTAYVPAAAPEAVVFAGDGRLIASWGTEATLGPDHIEVGSRRDTLGRVLVPAVRGSRPGDGDSCAVDVRPQAARAQLSA